MAESAKLDLSHVPDETVDEMMRLAEKTLDDTIQLAIAADQRGMTMAGILGATAIGLFAAAAALTTPVTAPPVTAALTATDTFDHALTIALLVTGLGLFAASLFCAWSARPIDFYIGGYEPRLLVDGPTDRFWMPRYVVADLQFRISKNSIALASAAKRLIVGIAIAAAAPLAGISAYAIVTILHLS